MTKKLILKTPLVSETFLKRLTHFPEIQRDKLELALSQEKNTAPQQISLVLSDEARNLYLRLVF